GVLLDELLVLHDHVGQVADAEFLGDADLALLGASRQRWQREEKDGARRCAQRERSESQVFHRYFKSHGCSSPPPERLPPRRRAVRLFRSLDGISGEGGVPKQAVNKLAVGQRDK